MTIRVHFFAILRDLVECDSKLLEIPQGGTAGELWDLLEKEHPRLAAFRSSRLFAVNCDYATESRPLQDGDEVAILPPLSGG